MLKNKLINSTPLLTLFNGKYKSQMSESNTDSTKHSNDTKDSVDNKITEDKSIKTNIYSSEINKENIDHKDSSQKSHIKPSFDEKKNEFFISNGDNVEQVDQDVTKEAIGDTIKIDFTQCDLDEDRNDEEKETTSCWSRFFCCSM